MAVRRSPKFRFDYFLRSLPIDLMGKRCEHLMKAAEKEVEHLEKKAREDAGLAVEDSSPVKLPSFRVMQRQRRLHNQAEIEKEKHRLEQRVDEIEAQMKDLQDRLKELNKDVPDDHKENRSKNGAAARRRMRGSDAPGADEPTQPEVDESRGAIGPDGGFVEFPEYDGSDPPKEAKKAFTQFCVSTRKEVKASLSPTERRNKVSLHLRWHTPISVFAHLRRSDPQEKVHDILRDRWLALTDEDKEVWRKWASWDKKRYKRDLAIYEEAKASSKTGDGEMVSREDERADDAVQALHVPKKRSTTSDGGSPFNHIPKKSKRS